MQNLSQQNQVAVATLPTPTAAMAGSLVRLTTNEKPYWCNGAAWDCLLLNSSGIPELFSTDPNISLATYTGKSLLISAKATTSAGIWLSPCGTLLTMLESATAADELHKYVLTTPFDISTGVFAASVSIETVAGTPGDICYSPDGLTLYVTGWVVSTSASVFQFTCTKPFDCATAVYASKSVSVYTQETTPRSLSISANGKSLYVLGNVTDNVFVYTLATAWDVSTATYSGVSYNVNANETNPSSMAFSAGGSLMFVLGDSGDGIDQYRLSTPWDVATATYVGTLSVAAQEATAPGLYITPNMSYAYMLGTTTDTVYQYQLNLSPLVISSDVAVQGALAAPVGKFGQMWRTAPATYTAAFTLHEWDNWVICNGAASMAVTLPAPASCPGRDITIKTIAAFTVVSASANVVPLAGGAAGTAILAATAGKWATLVSNGTSWVAMQGN